MTRDAVGQVLDIYDQMFALLRRLLAVAARVEQRDARVLPVVASHARGTPQAEFRHDPGD